MNVRLMAAGAVGVLVALGFVFPQIAELRTGNTIGFGGSILLLVGIAGTFAGLWCFLRGSRRRPADPVS